MTPIAIADYCTRHDLGTISLVQNLQGGIISEVRRLHTTSGSTLVLKTSAMLGPDVYPKEAAGLGALDLPGCPRVPKVLEVSPTYLLLEDLGSHERSPTWELAFARQLAALHRHTSPTFGWHEDNFLGHLPQINTPATDGIAFFIEHRILRYARDPRLDSILTSDDRADIDAFCRRFEREVPQMPPALLHGDLWHANALVDEHGAPAYVDPAVYYGLAESELSFTRMFDGFSDAFQNEYVRHYPLPDGWRERLPLYDIREWLGILANAGASDWCITELRATLKRYR